MLNLYQAVYTINSSSNSSILNPQLQMQPFRCIAKLNEVTADMKSSLLMAIGKMKEGAYFNLKRPYNSVAM